VRQRIFEERDTGTNEGNASDKIAGIRLEYIPNKCLERHSYVGVLISIWLFCFTCGWFAAQPKEFFLGALKKLEQRSHKGMELRGEYIE
jgi:hypothetical protein